MKYSKYIPLKGRGKWLLLAVAALVCAGAVLAAMLFSSVQEVEDLNGPDDHSLTSITLEEIISTTGDYTAIMSSTSSSRGDTGVEGRLRDYDCDDCRFQCRSISGIRTLQATVAQSDTLTLEFDITLTAGNLEIVILIDGEYHCHVDIDGPQTVVLEDVAGKTVVVRMGAEDAEVEVSVRRSW